MKTNIIVLLAILGAFFSCKKEAPYATQDTANEIEITFNSPLGGSVATIGNELNIEGLIDGEELMGGWSVHITNASEDSLICYQDLYEQTQYLFHYHWFPTIADTGDITVTISALDKNHNVLISKSVLIICE